MSDNVAGIALQIFPGFTIPVIPKTKPSIITPPSISSPGTNTGNTATRVVGVWAGNPTPSITGRWQRDGVDIVPAATGATYIFVGASEGLDVTWREDALNTEGVANSSSNPITVTPNVGPVVASQALDMGEFTLSHADNADYPINTGEPITSATIDSGDPLNHFDITATGGVYPTATGVAADLANGPYPLVCTLTGATGSANPTLTITPETDVYSVGTDQFDAVIDLTAAVIDGRTIKGRPGSFPIGSADYTSYLIPATETYTTGLTISSHDASNHALYRRIVTRCSGIVNFVDMTFTDLFDPANDLVVTSALWTHLQNSPDVNFTRVTFTSNTLDNTQRWQEATTGVFNGDGAGGGDLKILDFSEASPSVDLTGMSTSDSANVILNGLFFTSTASAWRINAVDEVNKLVTVDPLSITGSNPPPALIQGLGHESCLGDIQCLNSTAVGGGGLAPKLTFNDCLFSHVYRGAILSGEGTVKEVINCEFNNIAGDFIQASVLGTETSVKFNNNRWGRAWGRARDAQNNHLDGGQLNTLGMTQDNTVAYEIIGNTGMHGGGRTSFVQESFIEGTPAARTVKVKIEHNVGLTQVGNAIIVENLGAGSSVRGNSLGYDLDFSDPVRFRPQINVDPTSASGTDDATAIVMYNFSGLTSVTNAQKFRNLDQGITEADWDQADYDLLVDGPDHDTSNMSEFSDLRDAMTPKAGALIAANRPGIGAMHGYYNYTTGVSDAPWDEGNFSAAYTDQTDVALGTVILSNILTVPALAGANGVDCWSEGGEVKLTSAADATIIDWTFDPILAVEGQKVQFRQTSSGSSSTATNLITHRGSVIDTWTVTTVGTGFTAIAVDNTDTVYGIDSTWDTIAASKTGHCSMWFYLDEASWPTSTRTICEFRTAGGNPRFDIKTASSGRLLITAKNSAGTSIISRTTNTSEFAVNTWYHLLIAWNLNTPVCQVWKNDVEITSWGAQTTTDDTIEAMGRAALLATGGGILPWFGFAAEMFFDFANYVDLDTVSNRRNFIDASGKPVDISAHGSPLLLTTNAVSTFFTNIGSGGDLTETGGTMSAAASSPSD